jgi:hypothetical protein
MVSAWSKACTDSAPLSAIQSSQAASASAYVAPPTAKSAPYARMRAILAGEEMVGTKMRALWPSRMAA